MAFLLVFGLFPINETKVFAATENTLGGGGAANPLKIAVNTNGRIGLYYWQLTPSSNFTNYDYQNQYYNGESWGTNVFFTNNGSQNSYTTDYYTQWFNLSTNSFGEGVQSVSGNTITTTWNLGGTLNIKQEITYISGQSYYEKKWTLTNCGSTDLTGVKLIHGGDTYFGGDDSARSYWNPQNRMVYVRNADMTRFGLMSFSGSPESPASQYFSGKYDDGDNYALAGNLPNTADSNFTDGGYQLQWNKDALAAGQSWTIDSYETLSPPGVVQVISPAEQTTAAGGSITYEFVVQNFEDTASSYNLSAVSSSSWETSIQEGAQVSVDGNGTTKIIHVTVNAPANAANASSNTVTLNVAKVNDTNVKAQASTRTTIDNTKPTITSVGLENKTVKPTQTSTNVTVNTVNVPAGAAVDVQLLDQDKNPLSPAVTATGTVASDGHTVIPLTLPGNLNPAGTYTIGVTVDGVTAVNNSTTINVANIPVISAAYSVSGENYTSNTPTNKDIKFTSQNSNVQYSTNNGTSWDTFTSPMTITQGATYTFRYNGDTNSDDYETIVANINKNFAGTVSGVENNGEYTGNVTPVFDGATATISKNGGNAADFTSGTQITDDGKYLITFKDIYGNTVTYNFCIDKTLPTINVSGNIENWTKDDIALGVQTTAGISGISKVTVSKDGGTQENITGQNNYNVSSNGEYVFTVTNGVGATASTTVAVTKIDKANPTLSIDSLKSNDKDYVYSASIPAEKNVTINLSNPNSVISGVVYYWSTNGTDWQAISGSTFTISDTNNGTVNYQFKAVSGSGLESTLSNPVSVYIVKPNFTNDLTVTAETSDGKTNSGEWTNKNVTFTASKGINTEAFSKYQYTTTPSDADSWKDMTGVGSNTLTVSDDQSSKYYFRVVSKGQSAGAATEGTSVNVDKTAPTDITIKFKDNSFKQFINNISFGLFYNDNVDVSLSSDGNISGIDHYEYQIVDKADNESYNENGTWEKGTSFSVSPQFKGVVYARAVDKAGNVSAVVSSDGFVTDAVQPTSPIVAATSNGSNYVGDWTSNNIEVNLSGSSALSGINHYEYKIGTNGTWNTVPLQSGNTDDTSGKTVSDKLIISENRDDTYYFRAVSNSGIAGTESSLAVKLDNLIPETKVSNEGTINSWTKDPVTFTIANSNTQNIAPVTYWVKAGNSDWTQIQSNVYTVNDNVNTTYQFKTISAAGVENVSDTIYNVKLDKTAPTIDVNGNAESWTKDDVTLGIQADADISGISSITVSKDGGTPENITGQNSYKVLSDGNYLFTVTNGAGSTASTTVAVTKIDKANPTLSIDSLKSNDKDYVYSASIPTEKDVTVNLSNPNSVISDAVYYWSTNGTDWNAISGSTFTISDTNNGTVNYQFKAVSGSGLESAVSNPVSVYIVKPNFTNDLTVTAETSDGKTNSGEWTNKNVTFTVTKGINTEAFSKYQYTTTPSDADSWKDMTGVGSNTLTVSDDQSSKYYFRVVSKGQSAGAATEGTSVNVDKTAPADMTIKFKDNSFKQFINNISFGLFYNDNVDVSLSSEGNISGIDHYEYQVVDKADNENYNENGTWEKGASFSVSPQFKGVVYARAVDKAGNVSAVVSSDGFVTDAVQPTSPIVAAASNGSTYVGDWTSNNIEVNLSGSSALSGIDHYEYKIGTNGTWNTVPLQSGNTDNTSGKTVSDKLIISENKNGTYYFRAVSNSGIAGTESSLAVKLDNLIPETKVSNEGTINRWTKDPVTFTIANSNTQNIAPITYWVKAGNSDWTQIQSNVYTVNDNVNTTYQFKTISAAGVENVSDTVYSVKLDKTAPSINITGNPETWSKDDVTLAIQANTDISGIASITVSKDGGKPEDITGKDGYTVSANGNYVFKLVNGANQIVTKSVNVTKIDKRSLAAPANPVQDDTENTFGWTNVDGYPNISDYEYSIDNGATWTTANDNPQTIPDKTYDKGTIQVRVKADSDTGKPAGQALCSAAAYSKTPVAVTGSLIDGNSNNQISNVSAVVTTDSQGNNIVSVNAAQAVAVKQADGSVSSLGDLSKVTITSAAGASISVSDDGTIKLNSLANGTDSTFDIIYDLGNGQKIVIGKLEVKISSNGAVSLQSTLIDPYGVITDSVTGKPVSGVKITLYYADTARNRAAGKTPGTIVPLPEIIGFNPNNNHNSQVSNTLGEYGFMVFPNTDYYIVAEKDGYDKYTSPTIAVETDIVKFNITFTKTAASTVTIPKTGSPIDMEVLVVIGMLLLAAGAVVLNKGFSLKKN